MASNATATASASFNTVPVGALELLYCILGTPLNILVIIFAKRASKREMARHQVLVMSLATADLLHTSFHSPVMFLRYGLRQPIPPAIHVSVYVLTYVCTISSSLSLLLLNIDKFIYVYNPLRYASIVTRVRLFIAILLAWATSLTFAGLILFGPWTAFDGSNFHPTHIEMYITFMILFFMVPNIISSYLSTCIAIIVARHQKQMACMATFSSGVPEGDSISVSRQRQTNIPFKSIIFVFSATVWSVVTTLPYRLGFTLQRLEVINDFPTVFALFAVMGLNPVGNPVITLITHKPYRRRIRLMLCCGSRHTYTLKTTTMKPERSSHGSDNDSELKRL